MNGSYHIMEDFMSRKRTPGQPKIEAESTATIAVAEPIPADHVGQTPGFVERLGERTDRIPTPDPFEIAGDYVAGVRLFESRRDRQMAIKFDDKPGQLVIGALKALDYRWNPTEQIWVHPVSRESAMGTRIDAERLYQEVRQMVREEKGIVAGQEVPF
jgi:hypothetical protein